MIVKGHKNRMLTAKQEKYVQELIKGKSQREAYRIAYPNSVNWKDANVDSKASNLLKNDKVKARYNELHEGAIARTVDDAESMRAFIIETYKKIASGEICEKTEEYDAEGKLIRQRRTVKPSDVNNAIAKLAEYYGVAPVEQAQSDITITINGGDDYAG